MNGRFKKSVALVWLVLLSWTASAWASWDEAKQVVDNTSAKMMHLITDDKLRQSDQLDNLIHEIDVLLGPVVDFPYISKLVMGKYYRQASDQERDQFVSVFRTTLLKTYAKAILSFNIKGYEIIPPRSDSPKPDQQIVTVEVTSDQGTKYTLVYFMVKENNEWRLVNVVLDGVNLRITFKNQFADIAQQQRGDVGRAINAWQTQVDPDSASRKDG